MPIPSRNYWWLNANPSLWDISSLKPQEEAAYSNKNSDGHPRTVQKCFFEVRPGDVVIGYTTSPVQAITCLCEITRPNDGEQFFFKKLLDLPVPIPKSEWSNVEDFSTFQYQGSLFPLTSGRKKAIVNLIQKHNPEIQMPISKSLLEKLDAFLEATKETHNPRILAEAQKSLAEFQKQFPLVSLPSLTPEQYCLGKGDNSGLCWWVERGTRGMGSYSPGSSRSYGMYFAKKDGTIRVVKSLQAYRNANPDASDTDVLRKTILVPLHDWVQNKGKGQYPEAVGQGFGLKLLFLYYPDDFIHITSTRWMKTILAALDLPVSDDPVENSRALKKLYDAKKEQFPENYFQQQDFVLFFEKELNLKDKEGKDKEEVIELDHSLRKKEASMPHPLNTILCGPPGTSKTYYTAEHAVAIIEGKSVEDIKKENHAEVHKRFLGYKEEGRIAFTTFHQSYGYEDFIEGIRPVLHEDDDDSSSEVEYKLHTGTFKAFCRDAIEANAIGKEDDGIRPGAAVWKVSLEGTGPNETRTDCLENGYIRIGWDDYGPDITDETFKDSAYGKTVLKAFFERMQIGDIIVSCWSANETDAIGVVTGNPEWRSEFKHYKRVRKVRWLVKNIREDIRTINHGYSMVLSTVYRLKTDLTEVLSIVHKHRPQGTLRNDASPRVFVIDEINRGNISKIFGELITLIEPSKRLGAVEETKAKLPYSSEDFGVPPNVYILGTMNTADRSIALLDTALRRRFDFVEMMPDPRCLRDIHVTDSDGEDTGINLETMLAVMNKRIEFLLDREHTIGHAYFLGDFEKNPTLFGLAEIFRKRIVPLLQEYFFDDYSKIRLVLGDNAKSDTTTQFFAEEGPIGVFFGNLDEAVDSESRIYRINDDAFSNPAAYIGIYQLPSSSQSRGAGAVSPSIA